MTTPHHWNDDHPTQKSSSLDKEINSDSSMFSSYFRLHHRFRARQQTEIMEGVYSSHPHSTVQFPSDLPYQQVFILPVLVFMIHALPWGSAPITAHSPLPASPPASMGCCNRVSSSMSSYAAFNPFWLEKNMAPAISAAAITIAIG